MDPQKTSILVLDDEPDIRGELNEFLTSRDINVHEAATPSEAFRILNGTPVDIAILDIRLPEMNGLDVLKKIKQAYPKIQSIIISGHGDMDSVILALRLGLSIIFRSLSSSRKCFQPSKKPGNIRGKAISSMVIISGIPLIRS
jgi:DNA-binding NtrC family response regulator